MMDLEDFLVELFHSGITPEEANRSCPECDYTAETHDYLVSHIVNKHQKYLLKYSKDIDFLLNKPLSFFFSSPNEILCRICGADFSSEAEAVRHLKIHKDQIKSYKYLLKEKAEEDKLQWLP